MEQRTITSARPICSSSLHRYTAFYGGGRVGKRAVFASLFRAPSPNSRFGALLNPTNLAPVNFILFKSFSLPLLCTNRGTGHT